MNSLVGTKCEGCGEGTLSRTSYTRAVNHNHREGAIEQIALTCSYCGIESFDREEIAFNKKALVAFQMDADGIPPSAIREMRRRAGLSSEAAGELFGGGEKAFSKYENAQLLPDAAMRSLLLLAIRHPEVVELLRAAKSGTPVHATAPYRIAAQSDYQDALSQYAVAVVGFGGSGHVAKERIRLTKGYACITHVDSLNLGHTLFKAPRVLYHHHLAEDPLLSATNLMWWPPQAEETDEREGL